MREPAPATLHGQVIESDFRPHPALRNAHLQTLLASLMRPLPMLHIRRERLELPDGDWVDLGWSGEENAGGPIAILVHGLTGGFQSKYLRGLARRLIATGWRTVILQLRGAGDEPNRLPHTYNHGDTSDLRHLWRLLREREGSRAIIASVGWSLGGNVTLKALAEEGDTAPVNFAAAASTPFLLRPCADRLRTGFSRVYQYKLLRDLKASVRRKAAAVAVPAPADVGRTLAARDFIEFDNAFTACVSGYQDADDYYARAACGQYLHAIRKPTLIVHALDDPFMDPTIVPRASALSPTVTLELSRYGGHVGFIGARRGGLPHLWLEDRLARFLAEQAT